MQEKWKERAGESDTIAEQKNLISSVFLLYHNKFGLEHVVLCNVSMLERRWWWWNGPVRAHNHRMYTNEIYLHKRKQPDRESMLNGNHQHKQTKLCVIMFLTTFHWMSSGVFGSFITSKRTSDSFFSLCVWRELLEFDPSINWYHCVKQVTNRVQSCIKE